MLRSLLASSPTNALTAEPLLFSMRVRAETTSGPIMPARLSDDCLESTSWSTFSIL